MKCRIVTLAALCVTVAACSDGNEQPALADEASAASPWVQPPDIASAVVDRGTLVVSGVAGPGARVVLRGGDGAAAAVAADASGRFELRLPAPAIPMVFTPEVLVGEVPSQSPTRLVVIPGGPAALMAPGQATRRLDESGPLDAVDSDGGAIQMVGRGDAPPSVAIDGQTISAAPLPGGGWRAVAMGTGARRIEIGVRSYAYPGGVSDQDGVERASEGWRISMSTPPTGGQTTWLPD
jgi:hypothetical protein